MNVGAKRRSTPFQAAGIKLRASPPKRPPIRSMPSAGRQPCGYRPCEVLPTIDWTAGELGLTVAGRIGAPMIKRPWAW